MGKVEWQGKSWHGHAKAVRVAFEFHRKQLVKKLIVRVAFEFHRKQLVKKLMNLLKLFKISMTTICGLIMYDSIH